jgi:cysteine desulfurase
MWLRPAIYLDTASATPLDRRVLLAMKPFWQKLFANPASLHRAGLAAREGLEQARQVVAENLGAHSDEIYFTSGGTESLNWAIFGVCRKFSEPRHLVVSALEHEAVLAPCRYLESLGWAITIVKPNKDGLIEARAVATACRPETVLVAVMMVNNEIGTIQPIKDIAKVIRQAREKNHSPYPYFLSDACQAPRALSLNVAQLAVDLLVINGAKIYGPKGVGALYARRGILLEPLLLGGGQENGLRSGTSNLPAIVGLAKALALCQKEREAENKYLLSLRTYFWKKLQQALPQVVVNGSLTERLPSNLNILVPGFLGEQLVIELAAKNIACSAGSACAVFKDGTESGALLSLGLSATEAQGAIRFSLGRTTTKKELDFVVKTLAEVVAKYQQTGLDLPLVA